jgi:hypothetical protein
MVANAGIKADWKAVASLNGIENPRNLPAGTLVNLQVKAGAKASAGAGISAGGSLSAGSSAGASLEAGTS